MLYKIFWWCIYTSLLTDGVFFYDIYIHAIYSDGQGLTQPKPVYIKGLDYSLFMNTYSAYMLPMQAIEMYELLINKLYLYRSILLIDCKAFLLRSSVYVLNLTSKVKFATQIDCRLQEAGPQECSLFTLHIAYTQSPCPYQLPQRAVAAQQK